MVCDPHFFTMQKFFLAFLGTTFFLMVMYATMLDGGVTFRTASVALFYAALGGLLSKVADQHQRFAVFCGVVLALAAGFSPLVGHLL